MKTKNTLKVAGVVGLIGIIYSLDLDSNPMISKPTPREELSVTLKENIAYWKKAIENVSEEEWKKAKENYELRESREYNIPKIDEIKGRIKYSNGPTKFAGELENNEKVRILAREGEKITSAIGIASHYSREKEFRTTATGSPFHNYLFTVAINERMGYQIPCIIKITNLENNKYLEAIANDHGPYIFNSKGRAIKRDGRFIPHDERIVDLSPALAEQLGFKNDGLARVMVDYLGELNIE
jgi:rare lipoprotein A (peptidoglycan hydrolase)